MRKWTGAKGKNILVIVAGVTALAGSLRGQPGTLKWRCYLNDWVSSSPAVADDGTVYVGSCDGYLYAITPEGTQNWRFPTGGRVYSSPAIADDGTVYVGSDDDHLYAINPNGTLKWRYRTEGDIFSSPAVADDGTVYVGSDTCFYAISPDGFLKWRRYQAGRVIRNSPAVAADGTVYVGAGYYTNRFLYAINPDSTLKWRYQTRVTSSPAIAADGTVYVGSDDNRLHAINPNGTARWSCQTGDYHLNASSPAVAADGTIYVGSWNNMGRDGYLNAITADGTLLWRHRTGVGIQSSPAIAADGTVYVGSYDGYVYAIDRDGSLEWRYQTALAVFSSPAIAADGTVYVGSDDSHLYAIRGGSALAGTPWAKFRCNRQNTGCAGSGGGLAEGQDLARLSSQLPLSSSPDPFRSETTLRFCLPNKQETSLDVHDMAGRLVRTLVNEKRSPGSHAVVWDGTDDRQVRVPRGIYLCRLASGKTVTTRKIVKAR